MALHLAIGLVARRRTGKKVPVEARLLGATLGADGAVDEQIEPVAVGGGEVEVVQGGKHSDAELGDQFEDLEPYLGQRMTQAGVSSIERAWDGERRREFDAQELLVFAMVFDLPIIWFLLPPPGDRRLMRGTTRQVDELYKWLMGSPEMLPPLYERLRQYGIVDPTAADEAAEKVTGIPAPGRRWGYKERRKEMLLALVDQHADSLDAAVDELGGWIDHLRQVGIRGFLAEHTNDDDFAQSPGKRSADDTARAGGKDEPTRAGSGADAQHALISKEAPGARLHRQEGQPLLRSHLRGRRPDDGKGTASVASGRYPQG